MALKPERKRVEVPMTTSAYDALVTAAAAAGISLAEYIRGAALEKAGIEDDMPRRGTYDRLAEMLTGIYISVANGRAAVARTVDGATVEATNADALEADALAEVEAQGGGRFLSAIYECSAGLARRARWE